MDGVPHEVDRPIFLDLGQGVLSLMQWVETIALEVNSVYL